MTKTATAQQYAEGAQAAIAKLVLPPPGRQSKSFMCLKCERTFSRHHDGIRHYAAKHTDHPDLIKWGGGRVVG